MPLQLLFAVLLLLVVPLLPWLPLPPSFLPFLNALNADCTGADAGGGVGRDCCESSSGTTTLLRSSLSVCCDAESLVLRFADVDGLDLVTDARFFFLLTRDRESAAESLRADEPGPWWESELSTSTGLSGS